MQRKILILLFITIFLAGCAEKNLKEENEQLKSQLAAEKEKEARLLKKQEQHEKDLAELRKQLAEEEKNGDITIKKVKSGLSVEITDRIFFATGKADITPAGKKILNKIAATIKNLPDKTIRIDGHTDNQIIKKGSNLYRIYPTNWELAAARAVNVARYLTEKAGVDPAIVYASSYSKYHPIETNNTKTGRAKNRRIEIILTDKPINESPETQKESDSQKR